MSPKSVQNYRKQVVMGNKVTINVNNQLLAIDLVVGEGPVTSVFCGFH